ncbi:MAG TPA: ATP-binding protein [Gammaproteobacteria bacterium]|nr:ATP-binding protein [Gammaproteobacteria bacterium]
MGQQRGHAEVAAPADFELEILEATQVVAAVLVAADGKIAASNGRLRALLGVDSARELIGRPLVDVLADPAEWRLWQQAQATGQPVTVRFRDRSGTPLLLRGDVRAVGRGARRAVCGLFVDGSDDEKLKAAVQQSARMEALGSLTAGIAHDFNNLLTVLVGNLYLVAEDLRAQPKLFEKLKAARDAAKRGADLIKQLLTFARREELVVESIQPCKVVAELAPLLRRALGVRITLETELEEGAIAIRASQAQLESVIVNLAVNARDAIEAKGKVQIKVRRVHFSAAEASSRRLPKAGHYVSLSVGDDGCGIPADVLARVFDPFFSTKRERGGTGLGLSMVRWFAEQSHGAAELASTVGKGTTVTLLLPLSQEQPADAHEMTMPLSTLPTGTERVVVLAADEAVRSTILQILEVLGYSVAFTSDAEEVIASLRASPVDLLLIDAGARDEAELLRRARAARPGVKVIATADSSGLDRVRALGATALQKPFSLADLAGCVRRTLDGA